MGLFTFRRPTQLATEGGPSKPDIEDELKQQLGAGDYPPYVTRVIGLYRPTAINMTDRIRMRTQPDVAFMSSLLRSPIVNMRWTIESKDPALAAGTDALLRPAYTSLAKGASLAMLYGFQVIQPVYEAKPFSFEVEDKAEGKSSTTTLPLAWAPVRYKTIDPRTLTLLVDKEEDYFGGVKQNLLEGRDVTVTKENLIYWAFRCEDDWGGLGGLGIFDDAYSPAYNQAALTLMRNRYFERRADPTPVAYAERGKLTDKDNKAIDGYDLTRKQLGAMRNGSFVIFPAIRDEKGNRVYSVDYLNDDKRGDMYQAAIDSDGVQILKCGLVPGDSATGAAEGGSRARAEVHENRLGEIQQGHVDEWRNIYQEYARRVAIYSFGARRVEENGISVKAAGLSPGLRDLYREVLTKVMDAEATLDQGDSVPLRKRIDAVGMAADLELPLRPLDEAQEEWDAIKAEGEAKAEAIANGQGAGVKITREMEDDVTEELKRTGATEE